MPLPSSPRVRDAVSAPTDYAALYDQYHDYLVGLCIKLGIFHQNAEDVASSIMVRLVETDVLGQFDSSLEFVHDDGVHVARFQTFFTAKVVAYCRGHRDKQHTIGRREPLMCNEPVPGSGAGAEWLDLHGNPHIDTAGHLELTEKIGAIRALLAEADVARRAARAAVSFDDLPEPLRAKALDYDKVYRNGRERRVYLVHGDGTGHGLGLSAPKDARRKSALALPGKARAIVPGRQLAMATLWGVVEIERDLLACFDAIWEVVREGNRAPARKHLAARFAITDLAAAALHRDLKEILADEFGLTPPSLG